jgi:hypothetical protein
MAARRGGGRVQGIFRFRCEQPDRAADAATRAGRGGLAANPSRSGRAPPAVPQTGFRQNGRKPQNPCPPRRLAPFQLEIRAPASSRKLPVLPMLPIIPMLRKLMMLGTCRSDRASAPSTRFCSPNRASKPGSGDGGEQRTGAPGAPLLHLGRGRRPASGHR